MIVKPVIAAWLMSMMTTLVPRGYESPGFKHIGAWEARDDTKIRWEAAIDDLTQVVFDPTEQSVYKGPKGRQKTAVLMLSIAFWESSYRRDVDTGIGKYAKGDFGRSFCMMQIQLGGGRTAEGWSGQDLIDDRKKCFKAALHLIIQTWGGEGSYDALTSYASGHHVTLKDEEEATDDKDRTRIRIIRQKSRQRVSTGLIWIGRHPPLMTDEDALAEAVMSEPISQLTID